MGSKIKPRQKHNGRVPKGEHKNYPSIVIDSLRKYRGGPMRDKRDRRPYEKDDINEGWD